MHNILIVEDDDTQRNSLYDTIHNKYPGWRILTASNYQEALDLVSQSIDIKQYFSLFLLDIQLSCQSDDFNGFTLSTHIRSQKEYYNTSLLFLTSVSDKIQFALSHFHCYNYIVKPYSAEDVIYQIQQMLLTGLLTENVIMIIDVGRIRHRVSFPEICYIESKAPHTIVFHTKHGDITTREYHMDTLGDTLGDDFVLCHKKYIVNISHIDSYDRTGRLVSVDHHTLSVGRTYKDSFERKLGLN